MDAIQRTTERRWASPRELIEHIVVTCHHPLRLSLPEMEEIADGIASESLLAPALRDRLQMELTTLADLLETHIAEQEGWLFPMVRHLDDVGETEWACELGDSVEWLMERVSSEHGEMRSCVERVQECLGDAAVRGHGPLCELAERLEALRADLPHHDHLETELLFPWIRERLAEEGLVRAGLFW